MDLNSSQGTQSSQLSINSEDFQRNLNSDYDHKINQFTFQQIEHGVNIPAIVFEYSENTGKDYIGWDYDDLNEFFNHFGEIDSLEINSKTSYILFKTFFDANTAREFLQNGANFKESEKNNFRVRWLNYEDVNFLSEDLKNKFNKFTQKSFEGNGNNNFGYNNMNNNVNMNMMNGNGMSMNPIMPNMMPMNNLNNGMNNNLNYQNNNNYFMMMNHQNEHNGNLNKINSISQQNSMNNNNNAVKNNQQRKNSQSSNNNNIEEKEDRKSNGLGAQNGKYTCRFEIQIENDKEFQVARRLIGAKGCNMKKIVEMCSKKSDGSIIPDAVKLRLRGKGSGYKEGPFNKESDEGLHLCISSKFLDRYKTAIGLVNELITSVHEEYKKYCERCNKTAVPWLAIKKEEGISSRKNTLSKNDYDL